jgi:thiamine kinase-like enzyme
MGDRFFDLGNLAANSEFEETHEAWMLQEYFGDVQPAHVHRLQVMRLASDLREAAWGYLQTAISELDEDYLGYGRKHLERFLRRRETDRHNLCFNTR